MFEVVYYCYSRGIDFQYSHKKNLLIIYTGSQLIKSEITMRFNKLTITNNIDGLKIKDE